MNGHKTHDIPTLKRIIRSSDGEYLTIKIGTVEKQALHPQTGVPQLYFDQLNHVGKHLFDMSVEPMWMSPERYHCQVSKATI